MIGDGRISIRHRNAIDHVGGEIKWVYDPVKYPKPPLMLQDFKGLDYVVICSPSFKHREQTKLVLQLAPECQVIVEKPAVLPWEPIIDDDRINVVLQLRYLDLPKKADLISVRMLRSEKYFQSWKGDFMKSGGAIYNLFIHYIDLAIRTGANFKGEICREGDQFRYIDTYDLFHVDMQVAYNKLYEDVLNGGGIKPKDLFLLNYVWTHIFLQKIMPPVYADARKGSLIYKNNLAMNM